MEHIDIIDRLGYIFNPLYIASDALSAVFMGGLLNRSALGTAFPTREMVSSYNVARQSALQTAQTARTAQDPPDPSTPPPKQTKGGTSGSAKMFKTQALLEEHYERHGSQIAGVLGDTNYSIEKYLDDTNYIINNGTYVPELNGYIRFMSGVKYGFVGLDRTTGDITTFHIKTVSELIKKAPSLGFGK